MADVKEKGSTKELPAVAPGASPEAGLPEPETEELVLTVNRHTGEIATIHRVGQAGERQEFTEEEYAYFFGADLIDPSAYSAGEQAEAAPEVYHAYGYHEGYHQGLADYEAALGAHAAPSYSPEEEAAYHQGVADYHALVTGQV